MAAIEHSEEPTMGDLSVSDAIVQRGAVREFTAQPVAAELVRELLQLAGRAPSGSNIQPWKVYAVAGAARDQLCQAVMDQARATPAGDQPDIPVYPPNLTEPWRSRRAACGELMYSALAISRDDKQGRFAQGARNLSFFGAPVGLIVTMDRSLCESQIIDVGLFVQNLLLLAQERGLATCPQASWSMWSGVIRRQLGIADDEMVLLGIALGYAAADAPVNHLNQPRLELADYAALIGFQE
jgi:nitroreductase